MNSYSCLEYVNPDMLNSIIRSKIIDESELMKLRILSALIKNKNCHKLKFICKESINKKACGRLYPDKNIQSLQNIDRNVRKALVYGTCVELDIVNAFPTILSQLLKKNSIQAVTLERYVENRESLDISKKNLNRIIHSSKIASDFTEVEIEFFNEISPALDKLFKLKEYTKYLHLGIAKTGNDNARGTAIAYLLQDIERSIMTIVIKFLNNVQYETSTIIHDSILVKTDKFVIAYIDEIIQAVKEQTGYDIKLKYDDMSDFHLETIVLDEVPKVNLGVPYDDFKPVFELNHFKLNNPISYCQIKDDGSLIIRTRKDFEEVYRNKYVEVYNEDKGEYELSPISKIWMNDSNIRTYENLDFLPPPLNVPDETYNLFTGFRINKIDVEPDGNIEPFFELIRSLVNYDDKSFEFVLNYLAQIVQEPAKLNDTAIIIQSKQGAGKNTFTQLVEKVIGSEMFFTSENPEEDLFGRFSTGRFNKIFVNVDECGAKNLYKAMNRLKNFITCSTINYEKKGFSPITMKNFCRYIFTTNEINPAIIEENDRRFVAFSASSNYIGNTQFFDQLYTDLSNDAKIKAFYQYLMNIDLSNVNIKRDAPKTDYYKDIVNLNRSPIVDFLVEIYENKDLLFKKEEIVSIKSRDFYNKFKDICYQSDIKERTFYLRLYKTYFDDDSLVLQKKKKKDTSYIIVNKLELGNYLRAKNYIETTNQDEDDINDEPLVGEYLIQDEEYPG